MTVTSPYARLIERVPAHDEWSGTTRYRVYGSPGARHRLVFLHGLRGDHHGLEPIVGHLRDTEVIVPDLPGFGDSPPMAGGTHDVAGYAAWARWFLHETVPEGDAVLAGHSLGSVIGTAVAAGPGAPALRGLILVNPIAAAPDPRSAGTRAARWLHGLAARLPERAGTALLRHRLVTRIASQAMVTTHDRALRRWIHAEHDRYFATFATRDSLLQAFRSALRDDVSAYAREVAVPMLLIAAEQDLIAPVAAQQELAGRLPGARLVVVGGTGHLAQYEKPAAVAAVVQDFLAATA